MSSSAALISSALTCGVSHIGSHVVHTWPARRPLARLGHLPIDRAGPADRELQPVPILQVQPPQLVILLPPVVQQRVGDRQEHRVPVRRDDKLGLIQPRIDGDLPRRLPVVAQRDLDQPAAALLVVVPVDPQHDLVPQRDIRRLRRVKIGDHDPRGDLDRGPLVPARPRSSPSSRAPTRRCPRKRSP